MLKTLQFRRMHIHELIFLFEKETLKFLFTKLTVIGA